MIKLGAECFALLTLILALAVMYFYMVGKRNEERDEESRKKVIQDLTAMNKDDYDFMVANEVEMPQEVHDHFNPKPVRETHKAIPTGELEYGYRIEPRRFRKGERQKQIAGDNSVNVQVGGDYDPSMLQWKSWIETETIGGNTLRLRKPQTEWNIK